MHSENWRERERERESLDLPMVMTGNSNSLWIRQCGLDKNDRRRNDYPGFDQVL